MKVIYNKSPYRLKFTDDPNGDNKILITDDVVTAVFPIAVFDEIIADYLTSKGLVTRSVQNVVPEHKQPGDILEAILYVANASAKKHGPDTPMTIGWLAAIIGSAKRNMSNPREHQFRPAAGVYKDVMTEKQPSSFGPDKNDIPDDNDLPF